MVLANLFNWMRTVKVLLVAFACTVILVANSSPAFAFGIKGSANPSEGTAQLDDIYQESKQVSESQPRGLQEVQEKASQGLNGVQGASDASKMKTDGDSTKAQTVKDDVVDALNSALD